MTLHFCSLDAILFPYVDEIRSLKFTFWFPIKTRFIPRMVHYIMLDCSSDLLTISKIFLMVYLFALVVITLFPQV
jgi:hypothetical protein